VFIFKSNTHITGCKDLHQIEEDHEVPQEKTKMGFGEAICSTTGSTR
jgi:hypothetical protein